jgi:CheY-like chemotaxis protein/two-component sensor histidine kinase
MIEQRRLERSFVPQQVVGAIHVLREKKEQAERANHDKSRFLAVASHDLRQPIHALGLYVAELRRKISGEEQQHLVGQVERSVDAIASLINDLLDISRLDAGLVMPQKQACDVSELLDRITTTFQMQAQAKNIRLAVRPYHGRVISDPVLLERIVMNLVSNALRYTHPNGIVLIACRRRGDDLLIEVRDDGIGIDQACQANIFGEYVQLNPTQLDVQKGLGLGLAIVDRLVNLLDHKITLRSAPNKGSTFALRLALASEPADSVDGMAAMKIYSLPLAGKKLLIVDGDELVLDGTATLLSSWGCDVTAVHTLEAVQKMLMKGASWDLVISDYQVDGNATGLDVIQTVRLTLGALTPCIMISGDTRADILSQVRKAGHHFLNKPVKPAKLRSLVQFLFEELNQQELMAVND